MSVKNLPYYPLRWLALQELRRRCRCHRAIVLTYDDGPGNHLTRALLDLLQVHEAKATFYLLGRRIDGAQEIVELAYSAGHDLGVHTFNHDHAWMVSAREAVDDIDAGYAAAAHWVAPDGLFRPPHGKVTWATWRALRKRGAPVCWWTIDSGDTWDPLPPVERTVSLMTAAGGGVVLMHDFDREVERERYVLETTERLLDATKREGLRILTMSELLGVETNSHDR